MKRTSPRRQPRISVITFAAGGGERIGGRLGLSSPRTVYALDENIRGYLHISRARITLPSSPRVRPFTREYRRRERGQSSAFEEKTRENAAPRSRPAFATGPRSVDPSTWSNSSGKKKKRKKKEINREKKTGDFFFFLFRRYARE